MRIWVARPEPGASRTAARLTELGHRPLIAPVMRVAPTGERPPEGPFDAVLLTSASAAEPLAALGATAALPVFAVGRRTAAAARRAGFAEVVSADGDAQALAALVGRTCPPGARLLHPAGADRKAEPGATLAAAGFRVAVWTAYAARAVDRLPATVLAALGGEEGGLDGVLHYSRRSAETATKLAVAAGAEARYRALRHFCLSADVAVPLVERGVAAHFVAARPDEDTLLAGLAQAR